MLGLTLLFVSSAFAVNYDVRFCMKWDTDFEDDNAGYDDDYNTGGPYWARGAKFLVKNATTNAWILNGYTAESGSNVGCTAQVTISSTTLVDVYIYSEAEISGNQIIVWDDTQTPSEYAEVVWNDWSPTASQSYTRNTQTVGTWVNVIAASSYTVFKNTFGLTGKTFNVYDGGDDGTCATVSGTGGSSLNCFGKIFIAQGHSDQKYVISHEVGHQIMKSVDGDQSSNQDYDASNDGSWCSFTSSHAMTSIEYQSAAVVEGIAHFVAANTYNSNDEGDCWYRYYKDISWNSGPAIADDWIDCEDSSHCGTGLDCNSTIATRDHYGNECDVSTINNKGTEYDWLRFWWDLHTDQSVSNNIIKNIWNDANPNNWNANGSGSSIDSCSPVGNEPAERLRCAAQTNSVLAEWDLEDNYNGVHR